MKLDAPQLPGGPDPKQPVPMTPIEAFDLTSYARVATELAAVPKERPQVLARVGLDEAAWLRIEQGFLLRLATALLKEEHEYRLAYEAACDAARKELKRSEA